MDIYAIAEATWLLMQYERIDLKYIIQIDSD